MPFPTLHLSWRPFVSLALLLLGFETRAIEPPPTNSGQGTQLHATGPLEHVSILLSSAEGRLLSPSGVSPASRACTDITLRNGEFLGRKGVNNQPCEWKDLEGTSFTGTFAGTLVQFTIKEIRKHQNILAGSKKPGPNVLRIPMQRYRPLPEYRVVRRLQGQGASDEQPLCRTKNGFALAAPYAWSTSGELLVNSKFFTFACVPDEESRLSVGPKLLVGGGVIAKCIDWGYPPWVMQPYSSQPDNTPVDATKDLEAREAHQACVRMATADYCGEGRVNTLDGTPIAFSKATTAQTEGGRLRKIPSFEGADRDEAYDIREYHLEAAWGIDPYSKRAQTLCLSRARWNTLSLGGACINQETLGWLSRSSGEVRHCEDWSAAEIKAKAKIVSYSSFIDRVLVTFSYGQHFLTTADVERVPGNPNQFEEKYRPTDDILKQLKLTGTFTQRRIEGTILSRDMPPSLRKDMVGLFRCPNGQEEQGYFLTTDILCMGPKRYMTPAEVQERIAKLPVEGFIWSPDTKKPRIKPLYVWKRGKEGKITYVTSTHAPGPAGEYEKIGGALGYLPVMDELAELEGK